MRKSIQSTVLQWSQVTRNSSASALPMNIDAEPLHSILSLNDTCIAVILITSQNPNRNIWIRIMIYIQCTDYVPDDLLLHVCCYICLFVFRLGTSAEGANLRAKMQSASLVSDMESFKVSTNLYVHLSR